jgi:hypothetical protein
MLINTTSSWKVSFNFFSWSTIQFIHHRGSEDYLGLCHHLLNHSSISPITSYNHFKFFSAVLCTRTVVKYAFEPSIYMREFFIVV